MDSLLSYRSLKPTLIENITLINRKNVSTNNLTEQKKEITLNSRHIINNSNSIPSFWIEGYGCSASFADMEMIAGQLKGQGYELATNSEKANINLIVTCSVKDSTEHKMIHRIKNLSKTKKPLIIAGCLPVADESLVRSVNPGASLIGPNSINKVVEVVNATLHGQRIAILEKSGIEKLNFPRIKLNPIISIIEIASGCLSECSFCQTKIAKGSLQSYRIGNIVNQIREDLLMGSKEIWLTSTDNGCYGVDHGTNLINLLKSCESIDQYYRIRLGMMNPMHLKSMIKELSLLYSESHKLFKFIHIPVQSGSEKILKKMKRGHTAEIFRDLTKQLKSRIPNITIATDIITGFPSETDDDFEETLNLISELQPDIVNSSKYSSRPGTTAYRLRKVSDDEISARSKKLHNLIKKIANERNSKWVNWVGEILIDDIENGKLKGRNDHYKSIILLNNPEDLPVTGSKISAWKDVQIKNYVDKAFVNNNSNSIANSYSNHKSYLNNPFLGSIIKVKVISYSNHLLNAIPI